MQINPYIVLGSAVVGFLVGLTGAGGGALMTPMLILLFGIKPSTAISSDLVAAVVMRPVGAFVHLRKGTVNLRLVGWMVLGSVPMAFLGAYFLHLLGSAKSAESNIQIVLGAALLVGAAAMLLRYALDRRNGHTRQAVVHDLRVRPLPSVVIGMAGGLIVGITSVGSGSLMIVLLLFLYPMLGANQLVGTDLTQAVPLTLAAALGALAFGHVEFTVTTSLIIGSVPAVLVGSFLSSRAPDRYIRPAITFRHLRIGPQIRWRWYDRTRVDPVLHPVRRWRRLARLPRGRGKRTSCLRNRPSPSSDRRSSKNRDPRSRPGWARLAEVCQTGLRCSD